MNQRTEPLYVECFNCKSIVEIKLIYKNENLVASDFCPKCLRYIEPVQLRPIVLIPKNPTINQPRK